MCFYVTKLQTITTDLLPVSDICADAAPSAIFVKQSWLSVSLNVHLLMQNVLIVYCKSSIFWLMAALRGYDIDTQWVLEEGSSFFCFFKIVFVMCLIPHSMVSYSGAHCSSPWHNFMRRNSAFWFENTVTAFKHTIKAAFFVLMNSGRQIALNSSQWYKRISSLLHLTLLFWWQGASSWVPLCLLLVVCWNPSAGRRCIQAWRPVRPYGSQNKLCGTNGQSDPAGASLGPQISWTHGSDPKGGG